MSEDPSKKPNSSMEVLFGLIDSLQKHKRKSSGKSEPSPVVEKHKPQSKVISVDSEPEMHQKKFSFPIKTTVAAAVILVTIAYFALKPKPAPEYVHVRNPVVRDVQPINPGASAAPTNTFRPTTSMYPQRIMQQPIPVPAHMQIPPDPEEIREREDREREYDRLQNPEIPQAYPDPALDPNNNNISN